MKITLIGFMGCGKTTVGADLAAKLGYQFFDVDKNIETAANTTITEIFRTRGEDQFRILEQEALNRLLSIDNCVIATGGGAPCFFDNMENINRSSVSVYLKLSTKSLFERLAPERVNRPLIKELNDKELKQFISDLLLKREPWYNKAHYKVKAKNIQVGALADFIKGEFIGISKAHIK